MLFFVRPMPDVYVWLDWHRWMVIAHSYSIKLEDAIYLWWLFVYSPAVWKYVSTKEHVWCCILFTFE